MKKLILIFIPIILLSSCFSKNMEETKSGSLNTGNTETNTGEVERKGEMYGDIEIIDFPANQIEKLDKLPYPILSDKEPICKKGEQKVEFKKANITYCISNEYVGCNDMQCISGIIPINEALNIYNKTTKGFILYDFYPYDSFPKRVYVNQGYIDGGLSVYSKVYNYNNIFIIENYDEKKDVLLDIVFYIFLKDGYIEIDHDDFYYSDDKNPNVKRLLETLYISK